MPYSLQPPRFHSKQVKCKTLECDEDSCCIMNQSLDFLYCNRAWDTFARTNGGGTAALGENVASRNLREFVPGVLHRFFADHLSSVLRDVTMWDHYYECSSPGEFRIFRLQALALTDSMELLVCHTLIHAGPHFRKPACYCSAGGPVVLCSHCRRTAKPGPSPAWLWVPEHLTKPPSDVVSDLCPECSDYYATGRLPWPEHIWKAPL